MSEKITLSREQVEKCLRDALIIRFSTDSHVEVLRAALAEPTIGIDHETMRARYTDPEAVGLSSGTGSTLRAVVADPVPPAGGEPEVLGYSVKGNRYAIRLTKAELLELYEGYTGDALVELVDRAHVTRLQAEVADVSKSYEALAHVYAATQKGFAKMQAERDTLQSELTKARELIGDLRADTQSGYLKAVQALHNWANQSAPRGYSNIVMTGTSSNQSAPADKGHGQGDPVAWAMKPGLDRISVNPKASHAVFGHSGEPGWDVPLYAEPPAPVAVVMPSRDNLRDIIAQAIGGDTYDCTRVWSAWGVGTMSEDDFVPVVDQESRLYEMADACLDEFARLNPIKQ